MSVLLCVKIWSIEPQNLFIALLYDSLILVGYIKGFNIWTSWMVKANWFFYMGNMHVLKKSQLITKYIDRVDISILL